MNRRISLLFLSAVALMALSGCSDELSETAQTGLQGKTYSLHVTTTAQGQSSTQGADSRALSLTEDNKIHSVWASGDNMLAYSYSAGDDNTATKYDLVTTTNGGTQHATFSGKITTAENLSVNSDICFFYPGNAATDNEVVAPVKLNPGGDRVETYYELVSDGTGGVKAVKRTQTVHYEPYYETQTAIRNNVSLNLSRQDGTLETIDKKYDYNWACVHPESVSDGSVNVSNVKMQRKVAFWGLKFIDPDHKQLTTIDSIEITGVKASDVLNLKSGELVGDEDDIYHTITLAVKGGQLKQNDDGYVWVALLPGNLDITFTVYAPGRRYTKTITKDKVEFAANHTYRNRILLEDIKPQPYIIVDGTKWAPGNFIHYGEEQSEGEYWGIAPAQWWITDYATNSETLEQSDRYLYFGAYTKTGLTGSQTWYAEGEEGNEGMPKGKFGGFPQRSSDYDLWRWGYITEIVDFGGSNSRDYFGDERIDNFANDYGGDDVANSISGKFFDEETGKPWDKSTNLEEMDARYGDPAYYWGKKKQMNHVYRMPSYNEMKSLVTNLRAVPAFCYTDKGNKIYGAYFSDDLPVDGKEHFAFPTGKDQMDKYENVTGLVLADKGLFLPIAGRRYGDYPVSFNWVQHRCIIADDAFFGQYATSKPTTTAMKTDQGHVDDVQTTLSFLFGSDVFTWSGTSAQVMRAEGSSIRPVYVEEESTKDADVDATLPKYQGAFSNIITKDRRLY